MKTFRGLPLACLAAVVALPFLASNAWSKAPNKAPAPLAERLPADALVYIGWHGTKNLDGFSGSHLEAMAKAWPIAQAVRKQLLPIFAEEEGPEAAAAMGHVLDLSAIVYEHRWALYVGPPDLNNPEAPPFPKVALLIESGADTARVQTAIDKIRGLDPQLQQMVGVAPIKNGLAVFPGFLDQATQARLGIGPNAVQGPPLATAPRFTEAMAQVSSPSAAAVYVDIEGALKVGMNALTKFEGPDDAAQAQKVIAATGLDGLHRLVWTAGMVDKQWHSEAFLAAPAPRRGVMTLLDAQPLDAAALKQVPKSAEWFQIARFDLAKVLPVMQKLVSTMDEGAGEEMAEALAGFRQEIGLDLQKDIFEPLGDTWTLYGDPGAVGAFGINLLMMNKVRDAAKLSATLAKAEQMINGMLGEGGGAGGPQVKIARRQEAGATISYLTLPMASVAWTVHDGQLMLGLSPQAISARIHMQKRGFEPVTANPDVAAVLAHLKVDRYSGLGFTDTRRTAPIIMQQLTSAVQLGQMTLQNEPGAPENLDLMSLLPNMGLLIPELKPMGAAAWVDDKGFHTRSIMPFPGADMFSPTGGMSTTTVGAGALGAAILLPALSNARSTAMRVSSAANMRQIYLAMFTYSIDNNDKFPKDLGVLVKKEMVPASIFINPELGIEIPKNLAGDQATAWAIKNGGYVFNVKAGLDANKLTPDTVVVYERIRPNAKGINIVFGDGHVSFHEMPEARKILKKAGIEGPGL